MLVGIHQLHYLPWLRYFEKIHRSDTFVVLDNIQFDKNGSQNRNAVKGAAGRLLLTVPVYAKEGQKLDEVRINNDMHKPLLVCLEPYGHELQVSNSSELLVRGGGGDEGDQFAIKLYDDTLVIWEWSCARVLFSLDDQVVLDLCDYLFEGAGDYTPPFDEPFLDLLDRTRVQVKSKRFQLVVSNNSSHQPYRKYLRLALDDSSTTRPPDLIFSFLKEPYSLKVGCRYVIEGLSGNEQSLFTLTKTVIGLEVGHADFSHIILYVWDESGKISTILVVDIIDG